MSENDFTTCRDRKKSGERLLQVFLTSGDLSPITPPPTSMVAWVNDLRDTDPIQLVLNPIVGGRQRVQLAAGGLRPPPPPDLENYAT